MFRQDQYIGKRVHRVDHDWMSTVVGMLASYRLSLCLNCQQMELEKRSCLIWESSETSWLKFSLHQGSVSFE